MIAPLTPPDADLTGFQDMPFEFRRFARSDLVAMSSPEGIVAALFLWGTSWFERPAGSLTDDDRSLAQAAGYGRAVSAWVAIRDEALRGWVKCSDGRLYHPVVAEKVHEAWRKRLDYWWRKYKDAIRAHNRRNPADERTPLEFEAWLLAGRPEGIKDEARAAKQGALPLESEQKSDGLGKEVRRTAAESPQEKDGSPAQEGKGREQKGREGKGRESNNDRTSGGTDDDPAPISRDDLVELTRAMARAGAVALNPARPGPYTRELDIVRAWLNDGVDLEKTALPAISRRLATTAEDSIGSLKFYDRDVRKDHAKTLNGSGHAPSVFDNADARAAYIAKLAAAS